MRQKLTTAQSGGNACAGGLGLRRGLSGCSCGSGLNSAVGPQFISVGQGLIVGLRGFRLRHGLDRQHGLGPWLQFVGRSRVL